MPDPYLEAMMRGDYPRKTEQTPAIKSRLKDKYELAIEKKIHAYIDTLNLESRYLQNRLLHPSTERAKLFMEMKEEIALVKLETYISTAIEVLVLHGQEFLDDSSSKRVEKELSAIPEILEQLDLGNASDERIQNTLKISNSTLDSILQVAIGYFQAKEFEKSLSILAFLCVLAPQISDYWFRMGMAAQRAHNYDLAIKAYAVAGSLNSELIEAKLFSIECLLSLDQMEKALTAMAEAKELSATFEIDAEWHELLQQIEVVLKT